MNYKKIIALGAAALMLAIPFALFMASDNPSDAEVKKGSSTVYYRADKEMNKDALNEAFPDVAFGEAFEKTGMVLLCSGFSYSLLEDDYGETTADSVKIKSLEMKANEFGIGCDVIDDKKTTESYQYSRGTLDATIILQHDISYEDMFNPDCVDEDKAAAVLRGVFGGNSFDKGMQIDIKLEFEIEIANESILSFVKMADDKYAIKYHSVAEKETVTVNNGEMSVGGKKLTFNASFDSSVKKSADFKITKEMKGDSAIGEPSVEYSASQDSVFKIKASEEKDCGYKITKEELQQKCDERKKAYIDAVKGKAINVARDPVGDFLSEDNGDMMKTSDVVSNEYKWSSYGTSMETMKKKGFTVSESFKDVNDNVSYFIYGPVDNTAIYVIVAAVTIVLISALVFVVMRKKKNAA